MNRDERGAGAVSGLLWVGVLVCLGMACVLAVGVITTHRRSQAAADLAALAGAQAHQRQDDACGAAGGLARDNGARLVSCRVEDRDVLVTVSVRAPAIFGAELDLRSRARAGPVRATGLGPLELP